jgi:ABC-type oligopeptide transport system substrate-binding subunit
MRPSISRRDFLKAIGATATGAALAACQPKTLESTTAEPTVMSRSGLTNALGVNLPSDALPLDQQYRLFTTGDISTGGWGAHGHSMESMYNIVYQPGMGQEMLTTLDKHNKVYPVACESFQMSEDGLYWDFKLRKELVFSDGKPLTAEDWVYTLRRSLSNGYDFAWFYFDIKNAAEVTEGKLPPEELGIEAVEPYLLRIHTTAPCPHLPALGVWFEVAPRQAYEQYGDNWSLEPEHYISSGPYTLAVFERGVRYRLDLNPKYKGIVRPMITQNRAERLPTGLPAYIAGDIREYTTNFDTPASEIAMIEASPILKAESHPQPGVGTKYIGFNTLGSEFEPLNNPDVRLALCKAIDKVTLVNEIGRGFANPAWGILPKGFPNYAGDEMQKLEPNIYDVEAAKDLLAKAGYAGGAGFPKFEWWLRAPVPSELSLCQAIQAQWKERLGIDIQLHPADFDAFTDMAFVQKKAPLYFVGYDLDYYDPSTFLGVFRTNNGRHPVDDPKYDEVYLNAVSTLDLNKRAQLLVEAEKMLVNSANYYFVWSPFASILWPCNLQGPQLEPTDAGYTILGPATATYWAFTGLYWSNSDCHQALESG